MSQPSVVPAAPSVWRGRSFQLLWAARTVSLAGTAVTLVVLPILVFQRTGSPLQTSLLATLEAVPYVVFGLLAGAVADRIDRRRIMVGCDLASACLLGLIPLAAHLDLLTLPLVYAAALGAGVAFVWFDAANFGALPALVGRDQLTSANAILFATGTVVEIAGPTLGGVLAALLGPATAVAVDAASYLGSAVLLSLIPRAFAHTPIPPAAARRLTRRILADIREGLRYLWRQRLVRILTVLAFALNVTSGAVVGLLVVYGVRQLGLGRHDGRLGLLYTAGAAGGLAATLLLPHVSGWWGRERVTLVALTANAPVLAGVALAPVFPVGLALLVLWELTYTMIAVNSITIRQLVTPDRLQGRVNATGRLLGWGLGWPVGAALGGVIANLSTVRTTYLVMAAVALVAASGAWLSPLRRSRATLTPEDTS